MSSRQADPTTRLLLLRLITILIFAALAGQLALLQFVRGADYRERATYNRIRVIREEGARGVIYDRDGRMLARNTARFGIALVPASLPDDPNYRVSQEKRRALYEELVQIIAEAQAETVQENLEAGTEPEAEQYPLIAGKSVPPAPKVLTVDEIDALVAQREAGSAFQPVLVAENLPRAVAMRVEEQRYRLPGVELHLESMRDYLSDLMAQDRFSQVVIEHQREGEADRPRESIGIITGPIDVTGIAWGRGTGIDEVFYRVDGGRWQTLTLDTNTVWPSFNIHLQPGARGEHTLEVMASTDGLHSLLDSVTYTVSGTYHSPDTGMSGSTTTAVIAGLLLAIGAVGTAVVVAYIRKRRSS